MGRFIASIYRTTCKRRICAWMQCIAVAMCAFVVLHCASMSLSTHRRQFGIYDEQIMFENKTLAICRPPFKTNSVITWPSRHINCRQIYDIPFL